MARKRGGIAGFYDRNKKIIKPVAAGLAGMLGTPALGAAVGAAFGGLDREGKRGIGLDVMGAAKGGLSGYAAGSAGQSLGKMAGIGKVGSLQSAGNKLSGLFTGGGKAASGAQAAGAASKSPVGMLNASTDFADVADIGSKYITPMPAGMPPLMPTDLVGATPSRGSSRLADLGRLFGKEGMIEQNKTLLSGIGKGVMGIRQGNLDQQQADAEMAERTRQFDATMGQRKSEFDKTYGLDAAQEADRKRREEDLMAQRAAFRAMFTGMA
jgi:hypothetical protein